MSLQDEATIDGIVLAHTKERGRRHILCINYQREQPTLALKKELFSDLDVRIVKINSEKVRVIENLLIVLREGKIAC